MMTSSYLYRRQEVLRGNLSFSLSLGFECRCGNVYCGLHRYSDKHDCSFDYKADGRAKISKDNPVVVGSKIQKI